MRYLGGKTRIAPEIGRILNSIAPYREEYVEPFVGSGTIIKEINHPIRRGSDIHGPLITMLKALANGWVPPDSLSQEEHMRLKRKKDVLDPLTAFAGFGLSFGGDYFCGYAKNNAGHNYCKSAKASLLRIAKKIVGCQFSISDYRKVVIKPNSLVYCDPPYVDTRGYRQAGNFSTDDFWAWARSISQHSTVFVSEFTAPQDAISVWSKKSKVPANSSAIRNVTEHLFKLI